MYDQGNADYSWSDGEWHRITYVVHPLFGAGQLNSSTDDLSRLKFQIAFVSGDFGTNALDAYIRKPTVRRIKYNNWKYILHYQKIIISLGSRFSARAYKRM